MSDTGATPPSTNDTGGLGVESVIYISKHTHCARCAWLRVGLHQRNRCTIYRNWPMAGNMTMLIYGAFVRATIRLYTCKKGRITMLNKGAVSAGARYGMLTVISLGAYYYYRNQRIPRWICRCDCGKETLVREAALKCGNSRSCGCARITTNKNKPKRVEYHINGKIVVCTLTNGVSFLIDSADLPRVSKYGWSYNRPRNYIFMNAKPQTQLSRFLMDCPPDLEVDHINHNRLDNRSCNLRLASRKENCANTRPRVNSRSMYKGVSFCKQTKKWRASITDGKNQYTIGRYSSQEEAARAYDKEAKRFQGEFAFLNFV